MCFICTVFTNKKMLPWLKKGLLLLEEDKRYPKTMENVRKFLRLAMLELFELLG